MFLSTVLLEHTQLEGQMPNVRYIWHSNPKCDQQLEGQNWERLNFFGIVLQYHLKCKMVLQQYAKNNINILFQLFSLSSLSLSLSLTLSSLSHSSLSHFLRYYMALSITHRIGALAKTSSRSLRDDAIGQRDDEQRSEQKESDEREFAGTEECQSGGDHDGTCGGDWWTERRLDCTIGVGMDRWRLVGFSVEIGGLPMSPMMVSLKIANDGQDVV